MSRIDASSARSIQHPAPALALVLALLLAPTWPAALVAQGATDPPADSGADSGADAGDDSDTGWTFEWDNSFKLTSADGEVALKFGGRIQNDWAFYDADDALQAAVGPLEDGTEFRRSRLFFQGELWQLVEFRAQYDFAGGDASFNDVYLGLIDLPGVGGFRVGHFKEPFSLDDQTSSKYILFMERATALEAFTLSRNNGVMIGQGAQAANARGITWRLGAFKDVDEFGDGISDDWNVTGRLTGLPIDRVDGRQLLHLGMAASVRSPLDDSVRFRSRPESHLAPRFVDTGPIAADGQTQLGLELAFVRGPLLVQSEWVRTDVDTLAGADPTFQGGYLSAGWILKRDYRHPYKDGAFDRLEVKPGDRFRRGGWGVWELAIRYSTVDLTDAGIQGGEMEDWTLGINGYLLGNVRTTVNYVHADLDGVGEADALQMRFQVDF